MIGAVWFEHSRPLGLDCWTVRGMTGRGTESLATVQLCGAARALPDEVRERLVRDFRTALAGELHGETPEATRSNNAPEAA